MSIKLKKGQLELAFNTRPTPLMLTKKVLFFGMTLEIPTWHKYIYLAPDTVSTPWIMSSEHDSKELDIVHGKDFIAVGKCTDLELPNTLHRMLYPIGTRFDISFDEQSQDDLPIDEHWEID